MTFTIKLYELKYFNLCVRILFFYFSYVIGDDEWRMIIENITAKGNE